MKTYTNPDDWAAGMKAKLDSALDESKRLAGDPGGVHDYWLFDHSSVGIDTFVKRMADRYFELSHDAEPQWMPTDAYNAANTGKPHYSMTEPQFDARWRDYRARLVAATPEQRVTF